MRVLIINTSERIGGAAIAAHRLMEALKNNGIKAKMLVRDKQTDQISVVQLKNRGGKYGNSSGSVSLSGKPTTSRNITCLPLT